MQCTPQRRRRTAIVALALTLCVLPLVAAQCHSGGVIGASSDPTGGASPAGTSANRLCVWAHDFDYNNGNGTWARGQAHCAANRQIFQTCNVTVYAAATGWGVYNNETHGQNNCNAFVRATCPDCWQARGSQFVVWLRLDNPARRWAEGFVGGDRMYCDKSFTGAGQHRLRCLTWHGNGPISGALTSATQKRALDRACAGRVVSAQCARVSSRITRDLLRLPSIRAKISRHLDRLER